MNRNQDRNQERRPVQDPDEMRHTREMRESVDRENAERLARERLTEGQRAKQRRDNREKQR